MCTTAASPVGKCLVYAQNKSRAENEGFPSVMEAQVSAQVTAEHRFDVKPSTIASGRARSGRTWA